MSLQALGVLGFNSGAAINEISMDEIQSKFNIKMHQVKALSLLPFKYTKQLPTLTFYLGLYSTTTFYNNDEENRSKAV